MAFRDNQPEENSYCSPAPKYEHFFENWYLKPRRGIFRQFIQLPQEEPVEEASNLKDIVPDIPPGQTSGQAVKPPPKKRNWPWPPLTEPRRSKRLSILQAKTDAATE